MYFLPVLEAGSLINMLAGVIFFSKASLLGLQMAAFSLHPRVVFLLYVSLSRFSLLIRIPVILDWDPF